MEDKEKIENPQAFPLNDTQFKAVQSEMELRDYFAAKVLNGIHSSPTMWTNMCEDKKQCTRFKSDTMQDYIAQECYTMADAMLKERLKSN